jgi:hypothetical protein
MWMMTKIGFFSIVEKPKGKICIRSRVRADLEKFTALIPGCGAIDRSNTTDYRYRCFMSRCNFLANFFLLAELVTYDNFKIEVAKTNKRRALVYHKVWNDLVPIEGEER